MWRRRLHVSPSNADITLLETLQGEGLTGIGGFKFDDYVFMTVARPDAQWAEWRIAVFLDGPVHQGKQLDKDELISKVLQVHGWTVLRYSYRPPLSKTILTRVIEDVRSYIPKEAII